MNKAVCVKECPGTAGSLTECLIDGVTCDLAFFKPSYASFAIDSYCVPSNISNVNIESLFSPGTYESWLYDMQTAWVVLALAAGGAILLSLLFFVFVRCCAGFVIWTTTICAIAAMMTLGVFFILTAKGVVIDDYVSNNLSDLSYDTLMATGIVSIIGAILLFLLVCCLHSRLQTGIKAVELGSIFLFDNCCMVMLPVTQVIFILGSILALIYGAGCLFSLGTFSFPNQAALPVINIDDWQTTMLIVYFAAAVWMIFFFHGCNHYMLCSSVAIWYFDGTNGM